MRRLIIAAFPGAIMGMSMFAGIVGRIRSFQVAPGESGRRWGRWVVAIALLLGALTAVQAADAPPAAPDHRLKISSKLRGALSDPATPAMGLGRRLGALVRSTGHADTTYVQLDVVVDDATLAAIRATGAIILNTNARRNLVSIEATAAQIDAVAALPAVASILLPSKPFHRSQPGTVINQAGNVIRADQLTTATGDVGAGQIIGIISDSINFSTNVTGGTTTGSTAPFTLANTTPQRRGDLPAAIQVVQFGRADEGATDEGEAMMEECYKLAPGASYAFGSCNKAGALFDQANMEETINALSTKAHCTIIADDIGFFDEPMFQDGPIAQAANDFTLSGGVYLSAYGNDGTAGVQFTYSDVNAGAADPHLGYPLSDTRLPNGADFHNWGGGSGFLHLKVIGDLVVTLEWSQPFHRYQLGNGSQSDYDLFLYKNPNVTRADLLDPDPLDSRTPSISNDNQGRSGAPSGDPVEVVGHTAADNTEYDVYVAVDKVGGVSGDLMRLVIHAGRVRFMDTVVTGANAETGFGHPTATGVLGIAAVDFQAPTVPESFTSMGGYGPTAGVPFFFDTTGAPLAGAPVRRDKPDFAAPDGVSTSNSPEFNPFYGTSAAVPNAAAAAALTWSANPTLTNAQVTSRLTSTVKTISGGTAFIGLGLVQAQRAAGVPVTSITSAATGSHETGTIDITVTFAFAVNVTGTPQLQLNTTPPRLASYVSGSGTANLVFRYTVTAGDASAHLDLASATPFVLTGGGITAISADAPTYLAGDPIMLLVPAPGTTNSLGGSTTIVVDTTGPLVTITSSPGIQNTTDFTFVVTFAQPVTGVSAASFTATNGTITSEAGTGAVYIVHVTATAPGTVTLRIAANLVIDGAGLPNHAASGSATYDTTRPTLVITPTVNTIVTTNVDSVTFTFSEPVVGFTAADVTVTNGTPGALTGNGAVYHMPVVSGTPGPMTITVLGGTVTDLATNASSADATATVTVTTVPSGSGHGCGLGSMFASVFGLGLLAVMARLRGRDGAARR